VVPKEFIEKLIELGKIQDIENPDVRSQFIVLKPFENYMVGTWQEWFPVCERLPGDDHVALMRALVFAEHYAQIGGQDSGSSGVWVYRKLQERLSYREAFEIAKWVVKYTRSAYLPFGNIPNRMFFEEHLEKFDCEYEGTLLKKIGIERSIHRAKKEQAASTGKKSS